MSSGHHNPRHQQIRSRIAAENGYPSCVVLDCGRPTMARAGTGLNRNYCRAHVEHFRRHGSYSKPSYSAAQLAPRRAAALAWIKANQGLPAVTSARDRVKTRMWAVGSPESAFRLRGMSPSARSGNVWALLRARAVDADEVLAVWLAVCMAHDDDPQPERKLEYRHVQAAKVVHRLAGGTHRRWERQSDDGTTFATELHKYPASKGNVLRHTGEAVRAMAGGLEVHLPAIRVQPAPSHRPRRVRPRARAKT
jgi:hypothetical protein